MGFEPHVVQQLDLEKGPTLALEAGRQVVSRNWDRVVSRPNSIGQPYMAYMAEKDRVVLVANPDSQIIFSDDHGSSWTEPRPIHTDDQGEPDAGHICTLGYLGHGKLVVGTASTRWFSEAYGQTWGDPVPVPPEDSGHPWNQWEPMLVDRDAATGRVSRLAETAWNRGDGSWPQALEQGFIRFSYDQGRTWQDQIAVPQWKGFGEIALYRAANGNLIAGCRSHMPSWYAGRSDYYSGVGVSISQDDGMTWSAVSMLHTFGRHHPCMAVMADGAIVMTYVVRLGYRGDAQGYAQRGVEAVVSRDHGVTWDMGHPLILYKWSNAVFSDAPQSTTTVALPDGELLTAFGAGYRTRRADGEPFAQDEQPPHEIVLIRWRLG